MDKEKSVLDVILEESKIETSKLSRRDALKVLGISPVVAASLASTTMATQKLNATDVKGKIAIVGGGSGGIMAMARLLSAINNPDITLIAPNEKHIYQPGQVFEAAGLYENSDLFRDNSDFIPKEVKWIKEEVTTFDPENNELICESGLKVKYDYLVIATGIGYEYEKIKGLTKEDIGKNGISSVYLNDPKAGTATGGTITNKWINDIKEAAKTKKPKVIYTQPNTPIKCGGAPQKILYLSADTFRKEGLEVDMTFATNGGKLFGFPPIAKKLHEVQSQYKTITNNFKHNLVEIDVDKKIATFHHRFEVKGEFDEDLQEYDMIDKEEMVKLPYDYIHIVPPMAPPKALAESLLGWQKGTAKGWLEVDSATLQHRRYHNVFGIGDVCGIPMGKTGGSARHHGPILVENLLSVMKGQKPVAEFDGYTVCPLKTEYGKIILAEFNYDGLAPSFPLDPEEPRWIWWAFDLYALKPMYWYLMLRGLM
jgi:sulfide:quinone oxidoreductase